VPAHPKGRVLVLPGRIPGIVTRTIPAGLDPSAWRHQVTIDAGDVFKEIEVSGDKLIPAKEDEVPAPLRVLVAVENVTTG
jgi:hypothetical protein